TDIMCADTTKWQGLQQLAALLKVPVQRIIAAGDFTNDLEMICGAGVGVAVRNALPAVKTAADYVTQNDNNHDAAAEVVEHFLLCKQAQTNIEMRRKNE
ncbi:MAG: HAD family hydrolase, partial [Pygmaiobacter massiliensis]|nr:HAD family hydrolase [Pygmaiobacter massiliensis]